MNETRFYPTILKNRRQVLGLLLGAPFLASVAFSQQKNQKAAASKSGIVVLVIDENGNIPPEFQHPHLSKKGNDILVVVNLHRQNEAWFQIQDTPFQEPSCIKVQPSANKIFRLKSSASANKSHPYCYGVTGTCPAKCETGFAGGDITIDQ
jgi:hypothetical protein